ncbi:MAG: F0F1-type ATP synthase assembly protein I [Shewanella sp.]|jgi:F0F1-type ATP synthase assembly protein I
MSDLEVGLLIFLVIGVIASNLAVLKYSAKYKMPQFGKGQKKPKSTAPVDKDEHKEQEDKGDKGDKPQ